MARFLALLLASAMAAACIASFSNAFVSPTPPRSGLKDAQTMVALAGLGMTAPAFAEEVAAEKVEAAASRIPLGGGFAINLDIPETGLVNIVVLIAGLLYLLAPLLSESMSTREQEIQTDIDDAIAKYNEATARLAEAQKAKGQADQVIAEINASIEKDQKEFEATIQAQTSATLARQAKAAETTLKELEETAADQVDSYIQ